MPITSTILLPGSAVKASVGVARPFGGRVRPFCGSLPRFLQELTTLRWTSMTWFLLVVSLALGTLDDVLFRTRAAHATSRAAQATAQVPDVTVVIDTCRERRNQEGIAGYRKWSLRRSFVPFL